MTYTYFPGCSLQGMAIEYDRAARAVCDRLSVRLEEAPNWVCCGATPAHATSHLLSIALPARTLAEVLKAHRKQAGGSNGQTPSVVAACAACYGRLRTANYELRQDPELRARVREVAEVDYAGQVEVRHLLDVLRNDIGLDPVRAQVARPLTGLRVACYYGCLLVRPPKIVAFDDPEDPRVMDELLSAAGATCVDWPYKTECCGGNLSLSRPDVVCKLGNDILREARDAGADALAVACPLCQSNLDLRQPDVARTYGVQYNMPILYFPQLLGIAFGIDPSHLGLDRLITSPRSLLQKLATASVPESD